MSLERDIQSKISCKGVDTITVTAAGAPTTIDGTEIDTKGFRGLAFAVVADEAIGTDVIAFSAKEATISGGPYTVVASDKILPLDAADLNIGDADTDGFLEIFGVFSVERYVKPSLISTTVADDLTVTVIPILIKENLAQDEDGIDGLP
jgi:hypothetical protein